MSVCEPLTTDNEVLRAPTMQHVHGWEKGRALCGAPYERPHSGPPTPTDPDCVVCWGLWTSMARAEQRALWVVAESVRYG